MTPFPALCTQDASSCCNTSSHLGTKKCRIGHFCRVLSCSVGWLWLMYLFCLPLGPRLPPCPACPTGPRPQDQTSPGGELLTGLLATVGLPLMGLHARLLCWNFRCDSISSSDTFFLFSFFFLVTTVHDVDASLKIVCWSFTFMLGTFHFEHCSGVYILRYFNIFILIKKHF